VTTLRDRTELEALVRELDAVRGLADSLRAQAHESANQLHTVVGMVELGRYDDAVRFATERVEVAQELLLRLQERVEEPALVALLLGKTALARERGITLVVGDSTALPATGLPAPEMVTIVGNLVDNAIDAVAQAPDPRIEVTLRADDAEAIVEVRDNGPGIAPEHLERVFEAGWSTKSGTAPGRRGLGLALVSAAAERLGGTASARNDGGAVLTVRVPARVGAAARAR
jgi:two-component system CitB family sensor kinase